MREPPSSVMTERPYPSSTGIEVQNRLDRAPADCAEWHFVPREHDAIGLRAVESARFVIRAFERTDHPGQRARIQHGGIALLLFAEQRVHVPLGAILRADLAPLLLNVFRVLLELVFRPRRRKRRARSDQISPLERRG